ncbi:hypothetical protein ACM16X_02370 [Haloarcula japonica]|uniref:hypothetical protein n=1 Tax=Haloarcula japonica TaxID=29282 RepID=UPI0039F6A663
MSFWDWLKQDAKESRGGVILLFAGAGLVSALSKPGFTLGLLLILLTEYAEYRKSDLDEKTGDRE